MSAAAAPSSTPHPLAIRILRRIFSFPVAVSGLLFVLALLSVRARFNDPDMWWHLRMGQIVLATHHVPTTDIFSFTTNHHAWVPHEWLSQVLIFAAYQMAGYPGLMLWFALVSGAILIAGYALCSLYSGNPKVSLLGALVIFVFATVGLAVRPQLLGYLLLIVELILIHLGRTRSPRWFWALPPLFALWINCHGSFFLGLLVAAAFLFSSFFEFQAGSLIARRWSSRPRNTLAIAFLISIPALFLNPDGLKQVLYPLDTLLHQPVGLSTVQEWLPLALNSQRGIFLLLTLAVIFLSAIARIGDIYLDELILLAAGTWLAGSHDRMLFVFGIFAAPILTRLLANSWDNYDPAADRIAPNAFLIAVAILVSWIAFPSAQSLTEQIAAKSPVKAVEFIQSHHLAGPMLNDYTDGGYLIWALPEHPVFVDGRGDVYEWTGVLQQFGDWANLNGDPNELLDKYNIQFCLLSQGMPTARILPLLHTWKIIYTDNLNVILVRTSPSPAK